MANGSPQNAGISAGYELNISGGTVTANGGSMSEAILMIGTEPLNISENATVYAYGGNGDDGEDALDPTGKQGGAGIMGNVTVTGTSAKLTAKGGKGGDGFNDASGNGGDGGNGIDGDLNSTGAEANVIITGGNGGNTNNGGATVGSGAAAVSGTLTGNAATTAGSNGSAL